MWSDIQSYRRYWHGSARINGRLHQNNGWSSHQVAAVRKLGGKRRMKTEKMREKEDKH